MTTSTYTPIASITLGSSASSVTFSSIPQDYRDLVLVGDCSATSATIAEVELNNSSSMERVYMRGSGSSTFSAAGSTNSIFPIYTGNNLNIMQVMDYSATDKHKTILVRANNTVDFIFAYTARWESTAAVTSIKLEDTGGADFNSGSTFALYGIEA